MCASNQATRWYFRIQDNSVYMSGCWIPLGKYIKLVQNFNMVTIGLLATLLIASNFLGCNGAPPTPEPNASQRIIGGEEARLKEFPYQLAFVLAGSGTVCGASLVHPKYALTAAHCTAGLRANELEIIGGEHILDKVEGHEQIRKVVRVMDHEGYRGESNNFQNDISILQLDRPMELNDWVKVINLAPAGYKASGNTKVSGWGTENKKVQNMSNVLRQVTLPIVDLKICADAYKVQNHPITEKQICAGYINEGGRDSCQGDSGGPLVTQQRGQFLQIGVVSLGKGCASKKYPGVFTSVAAYRSWIDSKIQ